MKLKYPILLLLFIAFNHQLLAASKLDSLKSVLTTATSKQKIEILTFLCNEYLDRNNDSAMHYGKIGFDLSQKLGLKLKEADFLNDIANIFMQQGEYEKALDNYIKAEKIYVDEKFANGKILTSMNIGYVYELQNLFEKSLAQYESSLALCKETGNKNKTAQVLNHLGSLFYSQKNKPKALEYFLEALKINQELNIDFRIMECLNNVGIIHQELGKYPEALQNFRIFLDYSKKMGDKKNLVTSFHNIALVYKDEKDYVHAASYLDSSISVGKEINDFEGLQEIYSTYSEIYKEENNFEKQLEYFQLSVAAKDSLISQTRDKQLIEMSTKYDTEKKEAENKLLKTEGEKQRTINIAITVGLVLVGALAFFIFRGYQEKQKANVQLEVQNIEIREKKNIIEEKQKEILDSISYAKRLQEAILPPLNLLSKHLPEAFIYYQPKDIVAGDFYWMENISGQSAVGSKQSKQNADCILIAAADCTGHGVPGAMVSVVCSNALNRSVKEFGLTDPGKILDKTRELVLETFEKSDEDVKDGMDISLVSINTKTNEIKWAGANNPLWYLHQNEMKEITADKQPIGKTEKTFPFTTHSLQLQKGDSIFLFTDGLADQFGGPKGKKFKYKKFQETLRTNSTLPPNEQKLKLETAFLNWKGSLEQVDDVCVIGIRL